MTIINGLEILEEFKKNHRPYYRFKCVCGQIGEARRSRIISGYTKSCGCRRAKVRQPKNTPLPALTSKENKLLKMYIHDANKRGIDFKLTKSQFTHLVSLNCTYCGAPPSNTLVFRGETLKWNGLDRVNSSESYNIKNVVPACTKCNLAKGRLTKERFLEHVHKIFLFNFGPTLNSVNSVDTLMKKGNTEPSSALTS